MLKRVVSSDRSCARHLWFQRTQSAERRRLPTRRTQKKRSEDIQEARRGRCQGPVPKPQYADPPNKSRRRNWLDHHLVLALSWKRRRGNNRHAYGSGNKVKECAELLNHGGV